VIRLDDPADLGPVLYRRRLDLGLTLDQVGNKAGMSLQRVHVALSSKEVPSLPTVLKLAHALGYDLALIPREDAP
jgi:DNA-binding phage protein